MSKKKTIEVTGEIYDAETGKTESYTCEIPEPPIRKELSGKTWKHIRSAPKDGEDLLLYCKAKGAYVGKWNKEHNMWLPKYIDSEECDVCSAWVPEPKYWFKLPQICEM